MIASNIASTVDFFRIDKLLRKTSDDSPLFRMFLKIGENDFFTIIVFCERHQTKIRQLSFDESLIIQLAFCNALFETNRHLRLLAIADNIIELAMSNNIKLYEGEDIYLKTLFQKAQAYEALGSNDDAIHIVEELLKIKPYRKEYQQLLKKCKDNKILPFYKKMGLWIF